MNLIIVDVELAVEPLKLKKSAWAHTGLLSFGDIVIVIQLLIEREYKDIHYATKV